MAGHSVMVGLTDSAGIDLEQMRGPVRSLSREAM